MGTVHIRHAKPHKLSTVDEVDGKNAEKRLGGQLRYPSRFL
jgi:hypothetical protein